MIELFKGDSAGMSIGAIIMQTQVGDNFVFSNDPERIWEVKEKTDHQLILVNDEVKKSTGCENCGGHNFIVFPAWKNSYQCQDCHHVVTLNKARVISTVIISTFANVSLDGRLARGFVRSEAAEVTSTETVEIVA